MDRPILSLPKIRRPGNDPFASASNYAPNGNPLNSDVAPKVNPPNGIDAFLNQLDNLSKTPQGMIAYQQHERNLPSRSDYELGKGKSILAILAGALTGAASSDPSKGLAQIKSIKDDPYNQALQDWETKGKSLKTEADIEKENLQSQKGLIGAKAGLLENQNLQDYRGQELGMQKSEHERQQANADRAYQAQQTQQPIANEFERRKVSAEERNAGAHETTANAAMAAVPEKQQRAKEGDILKQSKEYEAEIKPIREADRQYETILGLGKSGNPYDDLGIVHTYVQMLTKSARASVNGLKTTREALDWQTRYNNAISSVANGRPLAESSVKELIKSAENVHHAASDQRTKDIQDKFANVAQRLKADPREIMSDYKPSESSDIDMHLAEIDARRKAK